MINYKLLKENGYTPKNIKKINNSYLIETNNNDKYIIKNTSNNNKDLYRYLLSRNFNYFPNYFYIDNYEISNFIEENNYYSKEEKLNDLIDLVGLLHLKTTRYKKVDIDDYKEIYEKLNDEIEYLNSYFIDINNIIDDEIFMSPSQYLLIRNISKIYGALHFCKNELDNWYKIIKESNKQRVSLIHNNLDLEHFIKGDSSFLISWNNSKTGMPIYDIINLYKKYYNEVCFDSLLTHYLKRYPLTEEELKLLFINISLPWKITFDKDELTNTKNVKKLIEYIDKGDSLIRPFYSKKNKNIS